MNEMNVVHDLMSGLDTGDLDKVSSLISDDFRFYLPLPYPIEKLHIMGFLGTFKKAFPDWSYNFSNASVETGHVRGTVKPGGTHSNDGSLPGMPPVLATGKVITLPEIPVDFTVKNNKISELKIDQMPGGNFSNLMENLGINLKGM